MSVTIANIITNLDTFIGDSSTDRISQAERFQAITEATTWLLEELGNEHMTDRAEIEYLPTVLWYKMDNLTPYLLTAGQLRFKEEKPGDGDFTRIEARDLASMKQNRTAYAIERFNDDAYIGIVVPNNPDYPHMDLIALDSSDEYTYTGVNADNIYEETNAIMFDMAATGETSTGLETTTGAMDLSNYEGTGVFIFEVEIPDMTDVNSVSFKFGEDLSTDYWLGTVTQDINGNNLVEGVNTVKIKWSELTVIGTPDISAVTEWTWLINHDDTKPLTIGFKLSDLRVATPIYLNFKYIFYRVGKNTGGDGLAEFTATSDIPFFSERYPQYKFAVAHKAASVLYYSALRVPEQGAIESNLATSALKRYRKNFSGERDAGSSTFKPAGVNLRGRRLIRRR